MIQLYERSLFGISLCVFQLDRRHSFRLGVWNSGKTGGKWEWCLRLGRLEAFIGLAKDAPAE
mgnify:CR=1 FL=1